MTRLNLPLYVALAASILTAVPANGSRDTLPHQRMIRRRGPGPIEPRVAAFDHGLYVRQNTASNSAPGPSASATGSPTSSASSTAAASTTSPTSSQVSTSSQPSSTVASTTSGGLLDSLTNLLSTSSTIASTSTTPSTTSVAPSTSAAPTSLAPSTTAAAPSAVTPTLNIATPSPTSSRPSATNLIVTQTVVTPAEEASQSAAAAKKAKITQNTIISLVVIAACIGGAIAIWTVIRKWKLSPSEKFDDRMQPIDWAPQGAGGNDETMEEKRHRRAGSSGSHGSFTSAGAGKSESGHANGMYNDSQHGHAYGAQGQDFPPAHDFTAGPQGGYGQYYGGQQYAGGAGYADLQRGPSVSESTYSQGASVTRGMSYSRGPTAGYEAQPGAAGVPPLPNPYGGEYGYDDYAPQAGQPQAQAQAHQAQVPYRGY